MAAPTNVANVKNVLANSEPSTHGATAGSMRFTVQWRWPRLRSAAPRTLPPPVPPRAARLHKARPRPLAIPGTLPSTFLALPRFDISSAARNVRYVSDRNQKW
jgi:hypothetical protein